MMFKPLGFALAGAMALVIPSAATVQGVSEVAPTPARSTSPGSQNPTPASAAPGVQSPANSPGTPGGSPSAPLAHPFGPTGGQNPVGKTPIAPPPTLEAGNYDLCYFNGFTDVLLANNGFEFSAWCMADDFELTTDTGIIAVEIQWIDTLSGDGWDKGIEWAIYDDVGGLPGTTIASGNGIEEQTHLISVHNGFDWWQTLFRLDNGVELEVNTRYWLSLHWASDDDYVSDDVYWATSVQQNFTPRKWKSKCRGAWGGAIVQDLAFALYCAPKKLVWVDFDKDGHVKTCTGAPVSVTPSSLGTADRQILLDLLQQKLDRAVGAGNVEVCEGTGGPPHGVNGSMKLVINGGKLPKAPNIYGNVGLKGNPAFVNELALIDNLNVGGLDLVKAMAYVAAHEVGHKFGLSHNCTAGESLMTKGEETTDQTVKEATAQFSADEIEILTKSICTADPQPKLYGWGFGDFGGVPGSYLDPPTGAVVFDDYTLATVTFIAGSGGTEFGYMTEEDEFVPIGDDTNDATNPAHLNLYTQIGHDLAVLVGGTVYRLSDGLGSYVLSGVNPNNPNLLTGADVTFTTGMGNVIFRVDLVMDRQPTGGFFDPAVSDGCTTSRYCGVAQNPSNVASIAITACTLSGPIDVFISGGPPGQGAYLLIGDNNGISQQPPGSVGDLCVVGGTCLGRYAQDVQAIDAGGEAHTDIFDSVSGGPDYGVPSCGGATLQVGSTWYFQYWHRQAGQPSTFSDAICVTFL